MSVLPDASTLNFGNHIYTADFIGTNYSVASLSETEEEKWNLREVLTRVFKASIFYSFYLLFTAPVL